MRVYTGIDWRENKHDVVVMNQAGAEIAQLTIPVLAENEHPFYNQSLGMDNPNGLFVRTAGLPSDGGFGQHRRDGE